MRTTSSEAIRASVVPPPPPQKPGTQTPQQPNPDRYVEVQVVGRNSPRLLRGKRSTRLAAVAPFLETPSQQRTPLQWAEGIHSAQALLLDTAPTPIPLQRAARAFLRQALLREFEELGVGVLAKRLIRPERVADVAVVQLAGYGEINLKNLNTVLGAGDVDTKVLPEFRKIVAEHFGEQSNFPAEECASSFKSVTLAYFRNANQAAVDGDLQERLDRANYRFSAFLAQLLVKKTDGGSEVAQLATRMMLELNDRRPSIGLGVSTFAGGGSMEQAFQARFEAQSMANRARSDRTSKLYRFTPLAMSEVLADIVEAVDFLKDRSLVLEGVNAPVLERESRLNLRVLELHRKDPGKLPPNIRAKVDVLVSRANVLDFIFYGTNDDFAYRLPPRIDEGAKLLEILSSDESLALPSTFIDRFHALISTNCAGERLAQNHCPSHGLLMRQMAENHPDGRGALSIDMLRLGLYARQELIQQACELASKPTWTAGDVFQRAKQVNHFINTRKNAVQQALDETIREVAAKRNIDPQLEWKSGGDERVAFFNPQLLPFIGDVLKKTSSAKGTPGFRASVIPLHKPKLDPVLGTPVHRADAWGDDLDLADRFVDQLKRYEDEFRSLLLYAKDKKSRAIFDRVQSSVLGRLYLQVDFKAQEPFVLLDWQTGKTCVPEILADEVRLIREELGLMYRPVYESAAA